MMSRMHGVPKTTAVWDIYVVQASGRLKTRASVEVIGIPELSTANGATLSVPQRTCSAWGCIPHPWTLPRYVLVSMGLRNDLE